GRPRATRLCHQKKSECRPAHRQRVFTVKLAISSNAGSTHPKIAHDHNKCRQYLCGQAYGFITPNRDQKQRNCYEKQPEPCKEEHSHVAMKKTQIGETNNVGEERNVTSLFKQSTLKPRVVPGNSVNAPKIGSQQAGYAA